jgi:hypothetical protein
MFIRLLIVTFAVSLATCVVAGLLFHRPVTAILKRILGEELSGAWRRYITFAVYVVGVSGGVRIWQLEKYVTPTSPAPEPIALTTDRWALEVYRTVIETLQGIAWALLLFFALALVAYVILRGFELRHAGKTAEQKEPGRGPAPAVPANGADVAPMR